MENLTKMVSDKAGITETQATTAVQTVVNFLKDKMPGGVGTQVETFINSGTATSTMGGIKEKVGSLFGK